MTSPVPERAEELVAELRAWHRVGRFNDWHKPMHEALDPLGFDSISRSEWAAMDWYGPLETWRNPNEQVSDILFNGPTDSPFFLVKNGMLLDSQQRIHPTWLAWLAEQLLLRSGRIDPQGDGTWPALAVQGVADRLRYAITSPPLSRDGISVSIRLLPERWRTVDHLTKERIVSAEALDLLTEGLRHGTTLLIAGPTGSGKTTIAAALTQSLGQTSRIVHIEDGGELPRLPNSLHLDVSEGGGKAFADAVRFALRQRPDYLVVGEVRGNEAMALLQAAATGHPGLGTIHAHDAQTALRNLERMAMLGLAADSSGGGQAAAQIVRGLITSRSVNLLVVVVGKTASKKRRVLSIDEVLLQGGGGNSGERFPLNPLFGYDEASDALVRQGYIQAEWGAGSY